ncbi:hypothetical protein [Frondihabitans australicus]|uniref:hypothetical protein n=1 Tax=Frondihabitans australicus TaxID=386892 RepID=UPI0011C3867E|nr:hypothetical protein [Frondihabitans australicus]
MGSKPTAVGVALAAVVLIVGLSACSAASTQEAGRSSATPANTSALGAATVAHGTGITAGHATSSKPLVLTVPLVTGAQSIEVTVTCAGSGGWFVTDDASTLTREASCGTTSPEYLPITARDKDFGATTVTLDATAATDGKPFTVRASLSTYVFRQNAGVSAFCTAYSDAESTLDQADQDYLSHELSASQWQQERATAASDLAALSTKAGATSWESSSTASLAKAALAAQPGHAETADRADATTVIGRCENNDSTVTITTDDYSGGQG